MEYLLFYHNYPQTAAKLPHIGPLTLFSLANQVRISPRTRARTSHTARSRGQNEQIGPGLKPRERLVRHAEENSPPGRFAEYPSPETSCTSTTTTSDSDPPIIESMRILIGGLEIARNIYDYADGLRQIGHDVDTFVTRRNPQYPDLTYDFELEGTDVLQELQRFKAEGSFPPSTTSDRPGLNELLTAYDVYIFQYSNSLIPGNYDYAVLKNQQKTIVTLHLGSDIRHWSAAEPVTEYYDYRLPEMYYEEPYVKLIPQLRNLRMSERYSDAVFSLPFQSELAVRPYWHITLPVKLSRFNPSIPARDVPLIVHAPSRRGFKGTGQFLDVLHQLENDGVAFELRLLEGVTNARVIREIEHADIVLDQLNAPHYAMMSLEGMATGCAVATSLNENYVPGMPEAPPLYNISYETLYSRLKGLITDKQLRSDLAARGHRFVRKHHDHVHAARRLLEKVAVSNATFDYYPSYFFDRYRPPSATAIPLSLRRLTSSIIERHGIPRWLELNGLKTRGLVSPVGAKSENSLPRWNIPARWPNDYERWGWSPMLSAHEPDEPRDKASHAYPSKTA